jgi:PAS domain S-box-containing protein
MLVLRETDLLVQQVSSNTGSLLGLTPSRLLQRPLSQLGGDLEAQVLQLAALPDLDEPKPLQAQTMVGGQMREWDGCLHRVSSQGLLVIELEPQRGAESDNLLELVSTALHRFSHASSIGALSDALVRSVRDLTGYDRVMVYKFDPDGHGKIIAEARDPRLESLLGHHYPATDIPQRARELYLRIRVRVLSDVHYQPVPLQPLHLPDTDQDLDMSMCGLRSMSPLHLQYLKNMGVTGTLVVSLVREGRLWGLIAAHHYSPRNLSVSLRSTCDLLAEVAATRIAAIENYTHAQVGTLVRRLEQRLVEATSTEGDWRLALFRNPRTLLQPLEATGAALFHDGEVLTSGEVPSSPELRVLLQWVDAQYAEAPFSCSSVAKANPDLNTLTPVASGVLAIKLSTSRPDFLMWFRKEQLLNVTWAGDPTKPVVGNDPLELSPRRSFAAWSEIVRGTAVPWSGTELALARAVRNALVDIIVQVHAVRLLVGEHQLATVRATVGNSLEPVAVVDADGRILFVNPAFSELLGDDTSRCKDVDDIARAFTDPKALTRGLDNTRIGRQAWRSELELVRPGSSSVPVSVRAEVVPGRDGSLLGFIIILGDLSNNRRADAARRHLEQSLKHAVPRTLNGGGKAGDEVMGAILTNASMAAMDIADNLSSSSVAPLLEELEATTRRAADLYGLIVGRTRVMTSASGPSATTPGNESS